MAIRNLGLISYRDPELHTLIAREYVFIAALKEIGGRR